MPVFYFSVDLPPREVSGPHTGQSCFWCMIRIQPRRCEPRRAQSTHRPPLRTHANICHPAPRRRLSETVPSVRHSSRTGSAELAGHGRVKFHESEEYIFRQGDGKIQMVWLIQQGRVELLEEHPDGELLRDVLGEGDLLGLECFVGDRCCLSSARTASDVLLYGIRAAQFESLMSRHASVKHFLSAHFSVAADLGIGRTSWLERNRHRRIPSRPPHGAPPQCVRHGRGIQSADR